MITDIIGDTDKKYDLDRMKKKNRKIVKCFINNQIEYIAQVYNIFESGIEKLIKLENMRIRYGIEADKINYENVLCKRFTSNDITNTSLTKLCNINAIYCRVLFANNCNQFDKIICAPLQTTKNSPMQQKIQLSENHIPYLKMYVKNSVTYNMTNPPQHYVSNVINMFDTQSVVFYAFKIYENIPQMFTSNSEEEYRGYILDLFNGMKNIEIRVPETEENLFPCFLHNIEKIYNLNIKNLPKFVLNDQNYDKTAKNFFLKLKQEMR